MLQATLSDARSKLSMGEVPDARHYSPWRKPSVNDAKIRKRSAGVVEVWNKKKFYSAILSDTRANRFGAVRIAEITAK
jgi:hypothetical protein